MVVQVQSTGPSSSSRPTMETLNINICSPRSLTRADSDSDDDSETSGLESDSSALAMLKNQLREFDDIFNDLDDMAFTTSDDYDDDEMKQELGMLSSQEKMLKQELDMIDIAISHTTSDNEASQHEWNENWDIEPQDGEMELDCQQEPKKELQQQQQQQPHHGHATVKKKLTQERYEGDYRYSTEEAEMDTTMNGCMHGCAPSLCGVCYDGMFGVPIMVPPKNNHSQFLAILAVATTPSDDNDTRQVAHDKEKPVRGGETREQANSFHSDDDPALDTCSQSDQEQCGEDERRAPHFRLDVLRSEDTGGEDDKNNLFQRYSTSPSLDNVISDIASDTYEPDALPPMSTCSAFLAYSEATCMYLCSTSPDEIPIYHVRTMQHMTIEGIHSQLDGSRSKESLSNSQSRDTYGKDGSIVTLEICRSDDDDDGDDGDESLINSQLCPSESRGGDSSQSMKKKAQLSLGSSETSRCSQSMEDEKDEGYLATAQSIDEQRSIMEHKHSQAFDKVCLSQSLDESERHQIYEDQAKDTTPIATDSIPTIGIGTDDGKDGDGAVLSYSASAENQSSFAHNISQSAVDPEEERREQEETSSFVFNICACGDGTMSNEKIDSIKPSEDNSNNNNNNNSKPKERMEPVQENPTAEAGLSKVQAGSSISSIGALSHSQVWESCIEESMNFKIRSHGSKEPPKEVDATCTQGKAGEQQANYSRNVSLEKEAMKLINQAIDDLVLDDSAIDPDEIGEAYTEEYEAEVTALDFEMQAVKSSISMLSQSDSGISVIKNKASIREEPEGENDEIMDQSLISTLASSVDDEIDESFESSKGIYDTFKVSSFDKPMDESTTRSSAMNSTIEELYETSSLDKLETNSIYIPNPTKSIDKGRAPGWKHLPTPETGLRMSALDYELQFSDSLLGNTSHLGTFDASEQVSQRMSPSPSPSDVGTFDESEQRSVLTASQPPGGRVEEARRGKPAILTALEYEMQFSEDDKQLGSPTDESTLMADSYDEDPEEIAYRESVLEARTECILDLSSQHTESDYVREDSEAESNESYVFSLTSEDSVDIPMIVSHKPEPKIDMDTRQPVVVITSLSGEACKSKYKDIVSFEEVEDPLKTPTSEDSVDIPMIVRHKPEPKIEVDTRQSIVATTSPSGEACKSKYIDLMSFEAVENVPSDEWPGLEQRDCYLTSRLRSRGSDDLSDAPSDEMKSEKLDGDSRSSSHIDNGYYSVDNDHGDDLDVLEAKTNDLEVITASVNRSGSSFIAESVSNEASVEVSVDSDSVTVITRVQSRCEVTNEAVDTKELTSAGEVNQSEGGNIIAASVSNEGSVEVSEESDGDTVTNDAVDTKELTSAGEANQSEGGNTIAATVSNEGSVEVSVESDGDTVITWVQSRCEVTNDAVDTKELTSTGEANQSKGGKVSENDRETDDAINSSRGDNRAATPEGNESRDPLDQFPSLKEALNGKSTGRRKREVRYVKEDRSPLRFLFGCPENISATESDKDAPAKGNLAASEVATVPDTTLSVAESAAIDRSTETRYFSRLNHFITSVICGIVGDSEVEVQAAEPNIEMTGQPDSNESSERPQIKDVRDIDGRQPSAQKDEQDHNGILNAMSYRSYMESVREVKLELASDTGKSRLVFETEEEREIEAVLSDKLWLLGESVSVASSTNSAFGSVTQPNYVRDDHGLDIRSWDRQARELLQQNELLLQSMANSDFASYQKCVVNDMTGIDAGSKGLSAKRKEFHQYCFDTSGSQTDPVTVSIISPNIRFLSPDAAITSYTRIDQFIRDGKPEMIHTSETRVWQKRGESWVNCHFHQS